MTYRELTDNARKNIKNCRVCGECNGRACRGKIPGPGGRDSGESFVRNYDSLFGIKVNMDTLTGKGDPDTRIRLFGMDFAYPVFAAPVGLIEPQYGEYLSEREYVESVVRGLSDAGCLAFTGDGMPGVFDTAVEVIGKTGLPAVPTIKPWRCDKAAALIAKAEEAGAVAVAMDIDAPGIPHFRNSAAYPGLRTLSEIERIISSTKLPFILKGVMTVEGAQKAADTGAYGIVVSNHGGRALDHLPGTAEVLAGIACAVRGKLRVFVDGGVRRGVDVFKMCALGADAVLIGRPYVTAVFGGGAEGAAFYTRMVGEQLRETMLMTGASSLSDISAAMIRI